MKLPWSAGGVNVAGAGVELGVVADALVGDIARARTCLKEGIGGRLDLVVDADVVQVLVVLADADDVAGLLDGRIGGDFVDALFVVSPQLWS